MLEEIKLLLGDAAASFSDAQINLCYKLALAEVEDYCNREADAALELLAERIAVIKLNRLNTLFICRHFYIHIFINAPYNRFRFFKIYKRRYG